jgi:hypothetical protein
MPLAGCTIREGDELAECRAEREPASDKIRIVGKLRQQRHGFVLLKDRRVATALYVALGMALGMKIG